MADTPETPTPVPEPELPGPVAEAISAIRSHQQVAARSLLIAVWEIGQTVLTLKQHPDLDPRKSVRQLSEHLGLAVETLNTRARLAESYDREGLVALAQTAMSRGASLTEKHLVALMAVPNEAARAELTAQAIEQQMTANELTDLVRSAHGNEERRGKGGRPLSRPASVMTGAQQIIKTARNMNNRFAVWKECVFDAVDACDDPKQVDDKLLERMREAQEQLEELQLSLEQYALRAQQSVARLGQLLQGAADDE